MDHWWTWMVVAYASGSIPFGFLIGRMHGIDIRRVGSGNIGSTNVGRVLGKKWGLLCFSMDVLKGFLPVLLAGIRLGYAGHDNLPAQDAWWWLLLGAMAMMGHMFPLWLSFRGGKGVATALGVLLGIWPMLTLAGVAGGLTWLLVVSLFRYVSVASITASMLVPFYIHVTGLVLGRSTAQTWPYLVVTGSMALLIVLRHRGNLRRLWAGTEPRIGADRPPKGPG